MTTPSPTDLLSLAGRTMLITGAGQGVGKQTALVAAAHGAKVVVNDYHLDRAETVAGEITEAGGTAVALRCDVTDLDEVTGMVERAQATFDGIDILVNNAGNAGPAQDPMAAAPPFWETGPKEWDPWMGTSFYGVLNGARAVLPGMVERQYGRVITVISDAGRVGDPNLVVYSGAKAGAAGFSRGLARAVGRHGITVNCVALSAIRTRGVATATENEALVAAMLKQYVIRRLGEPSDAANMILFLASEASSWITGQTYPVNGGFALNQ
ncbi:SDR family oxidoreductase [Pseudonocardia kujensis]|uniref:SDR family NAD(P)-dependent oxidoreductase n=1 Tax=Pseudonocardia kujensis TaxID=1128675 RepID=UPI001E5645E7|nr:SDR family NAD(P)-dependent oxidoreductase [Pseudonocardia kujensis]MCE0762447.1 SDR family oxidoreductase [Pseudonocardia kujensis]